MGILGGLIGGLGLVGFIRRRGGETGSAGIEKEISVFIQPTLQCLCRSRKCFIIAERKSYFGNSIRF